MIIATIAAVGKNRVIGQAGRLPWHLPEDLAHFKELTLGKPVIMGRKTYESIGRPLPGRRNLVLSRQHPAPAGCEGARSVEEALALCGPTDEVMVAGGSEIYQLFLPLAARQYLTLVDLEVEGDTFYPAYDDSQWSEVDSLSRPGDPPYRFVTLERR